MGQLEVVVPLVLDDATQNSTFHVEYTVQSGWLIVLKALMDSIDQLPQTATLGLGYPS